MQPIVHSTVFASIFFLRRAVGHSHRAIETVVMIWYDLLLTGGLKKISFSMNIRTFSSQTPDCISMFACEWGRTYFTVSYYNKN